MSCPCLQGFFCARTYSGVQPRVLIVIINTASAGEDFNSGKWTPFFLNVLNFKKYYKKC
jgi:hypothetical protein